MQPFVTQRVIYARTVMGVASIIIEFLFSVSVARRLVFVKNACVVWREKMGVFPRSLPAPSNDPQC